MNVLSGTSKTASVPSKRIKSVSKFTFTRQKIEALKSPPEGSRAYHYDTKVRGLGIAVSPKGLKTFFLYRREQGRPARRGIGDFRELTIEKARSIAEDNNARIARGEAPTAEHRAIRNEWTLKELFDEYLERHAKVFTRRWKNQQSMFNQIPGLHNRKISSIRKSDVEALRDKIGSTRGKHVANRTVELLSSLFNKARSWDWKGENPASGVRAFKEAKRDRFLNGAELKAFFLSLQAEPNKLIRDFLLVALLTGARRSNVESMRWDEINWDLATWRIPAAKSKADEVMTVTLVDYVISILKARQAEQAQSESEWVFPGCGKTGHLTEPKSAFTRVIERAGITDFRLHDLRRTHGSWQAAIGSSLNIIAKDAETVTRLLNVFELVNGGKTIEGQVIHPIDCGCLDCQKVRSDEAQANRKAIAGVGTTMTLAELNRESAR